MACRNNYLVSILIVILILFLFLKPINIQPSYMDDRNITKDNGDNKDINNDKKEEISSTYTYGDVDLLYNNDPATMGYYRIGLVNDQISIPNSQVLTNKSLYEYSTTVVPKEKNLKNIINNDILFSELVDSTYCCDDIMNREIVQNYLYDNAKNRYGTTQENYFD